MNENSEPQYNVIQAPHLRDAALGASIRGTASSNLHEKTLPGLSMFLADVAEQQRHKSKLAAPQVQSKDVARMS